VVGPLYIIDLIFDGKAKVGTRR